ncbi:MAG TPA: DUF6265 family protein [Caulobacteraceae bacterium]|nr:DUF6265 family protein [Caulobacteraceae bacterium]
MIKFAPAALAAFVLMSGSARAQEVRDLAPGSQPAPATLADLKGLLGNWVGDTAAAGFTATPDHQVVGHLVLSSGGAPRLDEMWVFRADGASVLLSQKHFGADLSEKEDKGVWSHRKLVAIDPGHIYLEGLTWVTDGDNLSMILGTPPRDGAPAHSVTVKLHRVQ